MLAPRLDIKYIPYNGNSESKTVLSKSNGVLLCLKSKPSHFDLVNIKNGSLYMTLIKPSDIFPLNVHNRSVDCNAAVNSDILDASFHNDNQTAATVSVTSKVVALIQTKQSILWARHRNFRYPFK